MGRVAVIGEEARVQGYALAGALVVSAGTAEEVRSAWRALPGDVEVVVLTPAAAEAFGDDAGLGRLTTVMPP